MALEGLVNERGTLAGAFSKLDLSTIQHAAEITNDRRADKDLRNKWFWTADFAMYTLKDNKVYLNLARRENNLIFKNIEEATSQLINNGNYIPKKEDIEAVVKSNSTLKINLSDLKLKKHDNEFSYFKIDTNRYNKKLNQVQREFAERGHGKEDDFEKNMKMFKDNDIDTTRIYVLNPNYVRDNVKENNAIARACWLSYFGCSSYFIAFDWDVVDPGGSLRGVPKVAEGKARKNLVSLSKDKLNEFLAKYIGPKVLGAAKKDIEKLYQ